MTSLESNANLQDECLLALETTCAMLSESNAKLLAKVCNLESRTWRNNIRVIGIPESVEEPNSTSFFSELLGELEMAFWILRLSATGLIGHWSTDHSWGRDPGPSSSGCTGTRWRTGSGKLLYRGSPIALYEDYTLEVMEQHGRYREVMAELYSLGLKPALLFPARLIIVTKDGVRKHFSLAAEAKDYIASICAEVTCVAPSTISHAKPGNPVSASSELNWQLLAALAHPWLNGQLKQWHILWMCSPTSRNW